MLLKNFAPVLFVLIVGGRTAYSAASDYYHICRRNDPNLSNCAREALEKLLPRLKTGIPQLGVPSIDPLYFDRIPIISTSDNRGISNNITKVTVSGLGSLQFIDVVAKLSKRTFQIRGKSRIPNLRIIGNYDVDAKFLFLTLKGSGSVEINSTDAICDFTSVYKKTQRNGKEYFYVDNVDGAIDFPKVHVAVQGLFKDPALNAAANGVLNENFNLLLEDIKPSLLKALFETIRKTSTKAVEQFTVNELFP